MIGALGAAFVLIQFIPHGRDQSNPPVTTAFEWSSPQAAAIAKRSCYDCHSNQTTWWWAVRIAPFSWLTEHDISAGRSRLNFSQWDGGLSIKELAQALNKGMPPWQYTLVHPSARLTAADEEQLLSGFQASLADEKTLPSALSVTTDATAIIAARCGVCHGSAVALAYRTVSGTQAEAMLQTMVQKGASLTTAEEQTLVNYFTPRAASRAQTQALLQTMMQQSNSLMKAGPQALLKYFRR
ncbi:MAG: heme-binding domain-containing protein [Thermoleophilia bacterium]